MSKENIVCGTFRLNMNNPQHVKINEVMKNLNPKIYKSRNQFLVEAAIFYIEHYGEDAFMEKMPLWNTKKTSGRNISAGKIWKASRQN
jgi:hypothetical protein